MLNRRNFLKAAAGSAVLAGSSVVMAAEKVEKWDETRDVIVVGSGFAGLTAAYVAKKAGSDVLVIDKMRTAGGNSIINGGIMGVPGTEIQKKKGIKDSPELMAKDMLKAGLYMNYPEKVKALTEEAYPAYRMLVDELGVEFSDTILKHEGGHSVPRSLYLKGGRGSEIILKELAALEKLGVKPRLRCFMEKIILDEKGVVAGLEVREGYRFGKEGSGKLKRIRAKKGVVLAYGGFGSDVNYRKMFDPKLGAAFQSTNQPGATGEMITAAEDVGAQTVGMDYIQCIPGAPLGDKTRSAFFNVVKRFIFVNKAGKRFIAEDQRRDVLRDAFLAQPDPVSFVVIDQSGWDEMPGGPKLRCEASLKAGEAWKCDTIEELGKKMGVPVDAFRKTIEDYNRGVDEKKDALGRNPRVMTKLARPPFYAGRASMAVHHTMGGIQINAKTQVFDKQGKVIPGLFAAGEVTGGVHGGNRLGGNAIADIMVNGRIAGTNAAMGQ